MTGPHVIGEHGRWWLKRYEYEGAPLYAEHKLGGFSVEIENDGALSVDGDDPYNGLVLRYLPADVLRLLLDDYEARVRAIQAANVCPACNGAGRLPEPDGTVCPCQATRP